MEPTARGAVYPATRDVMKCGNNSTPTILRPEPASNKMALIKCPERDCGKPVSSMATMCPHCKFPIPAGKGADCTVPDEAPHGSSSTASVHAPDIVDSGESAMEAFLLSPGVTGIFRHDSEFRFMDDSGKDLYEFTKLCIALPAQIHVHINTDEWMDGDIKLLCTVKSIRAVTLRGGDPWEKKPSIIYRHYHR